MEERTDLYRWRETYFVWFERSRRPTLAAVVEAVKHLRGHFEMEQPDATAEGLLESLTVRSSEDHAALEIDYSAGEEVGSEAVLLAAEMTALGDEATPEHIARLTRADCRFEVMHFEEVLEDADPDELLDPSALLEVLDALVKLTDGVAVDPASGTLL